MLEAEPADLIGWTEGRALVAAGTHGGLISRFRLKSRHDKLLDETEALLYCDHQFGENSRNGNLCTLRLGLLYSAESKWPKMSRGDSFVGVPNVIARQINMLPAQRRQMF
jgi:hypothetical protein